MSSTFEKMYRVSVVVLLGICASCLIAIYAHLPPNEGQMYSMTDTGLDYQARMKSSRWVMTSEVTGSVYIEGQVRSDALPVRVRTEP
jgi:hypothetical protein